MLGDNQSLEVQEHALHCLTNVLIDSEQISTAILDQLSSILYTMESITSRISDSDAIRTIADVFRVLMEARAEKFQSQADILSASSIMT